MPPALRKKMDKAQCEAIAEEAAFVVAVVREVQAILPVATEILEEQWVAKYRTGDSDVILEVQSAIMNRNCGNVRDIGTIQLIMNNHAGATPISSSATAVQVTELQTHTFELKVKQLLYDAQALRVARSKRSSWESQVYHAKLQYRVQAYQECLKAARHFINSNCCIVHYTKPEQLNHSIHNYFQQTNARYKLEAGASVRSSVNKQFQEQSLILQIAILKHVM